MHLRRLLALVLIMMLLAPFAHVQGQNAPGSIVIDVPFEWVRQGRADVVTLSGPDLRGGWVSVLERVYPFFPTTNGFAALIAVPIEQKIRKDYPMIITVIQSDGSPVKWESILRVEAGEFVREEPLEIPSDRFHLLNADVQTNEDDRLLSIYGQFTQERFWEGQFKFPLDAPLTSPFGSWRDYNDGSLRRHTGYDFKVASRVPILATASGRVVFARQMDIHGNIVIIDHGWGIFSSYSHMTEMYVVPGQLILQGEVIGLTGNTGRSTGPHLHWEIAVNGVWINPIEFSRLKLPT